VRAVPWADEAEQQLSTLALSGCELCADVRLLGAVPWAETEVACLSCHLKLQTYLWRSVPGASGSPAPKMGMSARSSQAESPSLESDSSAHGTANTEAQSLGLLACLATSIFQRTFVCPWQAPPSALLPKCELLPIDRSQKERAWKAVAQPHLPMALLAQRHRDWGCLLVLPPQTSNVGLGVRARHLRQPCSQNANVCR